MALGEPFINTEKVPVYVTSLESLGLTSKEKMEVLFGVMAEVAIEKTRFLEEGDYSIIDSFAKLFQVILLMAQPPNKVKPLLSVLLAVKN